MSLTCAPAVRFREYLQAIWFHDYEDLDEHGHAPETLDVGAPQHDAGGDARWINYTDTYIIDTDKNVIGFRKADGDTATE